MLKALGRLMDSAGFDVEKFSDPITFLARLEQATCRLAVLDVWMPQMSGLEVQTRLRRDSPATQIIFLTGRDDPMRARPPSKQEPLPSSRNLSTTKFSCN